MLPNFVDIFFRFVMTKVILLILWEPLLIIHTVALLDIKSVMELWYSEWNKKVIFIAKLY